MSIIETLLTDPIAAKEARKSDVLLVDLRSKEPVYHFFQLPKQHIEVNL